MFSGLYNVSAHRSHEHLRVKIRVFGPQGGLAVGARLNLNIKGLFCVALRKAGLFCCGCYFSHFFLSVGQCCDPLFIGRPPNMFFEKIDQSIAGVACARHMVCKVDPASKAIITRQFISDYIQQALFYNQGHRHPTGGGI